MFGRLSLVLCLALAAGIGAWFGLRAQNRPARLIFLAVGQGDCSVFESEGATILIDVGPKTREGFDAGARIVVPRLRALGVGKVALVLLSHPDSDHIGGLASVMKAYPEARIGISDQFRQHPEMLSSLKAAHVEPERVLWFGRGAVAKVGAFSLTVLTPTWSAGENDNDGSMFVRIADGKSSVVFSGDAGIAVENRVLSQVRWDAHIVHVGHHGSRTATGEAWLKRLRPEIAVISCGRDNAYGHPHASVLQALESHHVRVLRTDRQGDLIFEATSDGFVLRR